ncbi:alpha/beta fold hydrolase [uncultured Paraglaciecola sp.]|uniref:alpha/beta fold hydrolase n=1 Tax=uncultured Paraglaciecola sp. TaxID=1765024 RepID=UPI0030D86B03|tara:strand:- start:14366 stop:15322 length:957 start_codon:yes stop_codon:yes gene_type:complete
MSQYVLCSETDLESVYANVIQPFWQNSVKSGIFTGIDKVDIAYAFVLHPNALGTIVISTGRIESLIKYKEVVYDLYQNGYSVFIHDHRGQGLSGRMLGNPQIGYVASFNDYVADFKQFMDEVVLKKSHHKPNLLCHSMGGAIGALMVWRYPELFGKVAFSAPMFGIRPPLPTWFAKFLLRLHLTVNTNDGYFFSQKNYDPVPFCSNELTHSEIRYQIFRQEYQNAPQVQLGGVSGHWLKAATIAMEEIEHNAPSFPIAALVIQAGADQIVDNKRQSRVVAKMARTRLLVIDGSHHELLAEQDKYRVPCLSAILDFLKG